MEDITYILLNEFPDIMTFAFFVYLKDPINFVFSNELRTYADEWLNLEKEQSENIKKSDIEKRLTFKNPELINDYENYIINTLNSTVNYIKIDSPVGLKIIKKLAIAILPDLFLQLGCENEDINMIDESIKRGATDIDSCIKIKSLSDKVIEHLINILQTKGILKSWSLVPKSEIEDDYCFCGDNLKNEEDVIKHVCGKQAHRDCLNKWNNTKEFDQEYVMNIDGINESIVATTELSNNLKCPYCRLDFGKRKLKSRRKSRKSRRKSRRKPKRSRRRKSS